MHQRRLDQNLAEKKRLQEEENKRIAVSLKSIIGINKENQHLEL